MVITAQYANLRMKPHMVKSLIVLGAVQIVFGIFTAIFNAVAMGVLSGSKVDYSEKVGWGGITVGILVNT